MDIYRRIVEDHEKHRSLMAAVMETSGDSAERRRLFRELKSDVDAHAAAEEQTFYAALISSFDGQDQARHSITEHKESADILEELAEMDMATGGWLTRFRTLKEELEHHMEEEEEDVFSIARELLSAAKAKDLAKSFEQCKAEHLRDGDDEDDVDEMIDESFPASDPPATTGAKAG